MPSSLPNAPLPRAGVAPEELDLIGVGTATPDMIVYGLIIAAQLIQSGCGIRRVLVIGAEAGAAVVGRSIGAAGLYSGAWARTAQKSPDPRPRRIALGLAPGRNARSRPGTARSLLVRPQY